MRRSALARGGAAAARRRRDSPRAGDRRRPPGHELQPGGDLGRGGDRPLPRGQEAGPRAPRPPDHRLDVARDRRPARQGGGERLPGEALGRREAPRLGAQPPAPARAATRERPSARPGAAELGGPRRASRPLRRGLGEREDARRGHPRPAGGPRRDPGADHRPLRRRQGEAGRDRPGQLAAQGAPVRPRQRRRAPRRAAGERALRRRGRRLYRLHPAADRPLRGGGRRHPVPRRDRQPLRLGAGEAPARAPERPVRAPG